MSNGPVGVGFIGTGNISNTYLENLTSFPDISVVILGDLDTQRAAEQATAHGVPASGSAEDVLAHPDVEIVVNLTIPAVHAEISQAVLAAGKHVWTEKPLATTREDGTAVLKKAEQAGLRVGVAPDTILGPGFQTARRAIERGDIGTPLSALTAFQYPGPDIWHPNPDFLFAAGAGPLYDMGPYYISALANIFGPFAHVAAVGTQSSATRTVQVGERAGTEFPVSVPTHVNVIAQFEGGGTSQSQLSFDSPMVRSGLVEITGTEGTMIIPDPNAFTGDIRITRAPKDFTAEPVWEQVPVEGVETGRGTGVLDLARAIRENRPHIASAELGYHVLDTLAAIEESISSAQTVQVSSTIPTIPLIPTNWDPFATTL